MKRLNSLIKEIPENVTLSRREFLLTIVVCVLGGIVFGVFCGPKKEVAIGSNNGNNCHDNYAGLQEKEEDA